MQGELNSSARVAPVNRPGLREGRATVRAISRVLVRLKPNPSRDRFADTVDDVLRWINKRSGRPLPGAAWQRSSFDLADVGAQRASAVALSVPKYWAARLDDADKNVPLRTWVTEIGVGVADDGDILFGARLLCATRGQDDAFERSVPGFVRHIVTAGAAEVDGRRVSTTPHFVSSADDVERLVALLEMPDRSADVIVCSLPEGSEDPAKVAVSATELCSRLLGVAHVFIITGPASYDLTNRIGRELSVFKQAIRTYRPGLRAWLDEPARHPLALPTKINTWAGEGAKAFESWLVNHALAASVHHSRGDDRMPSFETVRQLDATERRAAARQDGDAASLLKLFEDDNGKLRQQLKEQQEEADSLLTEAEREREVALEAANMARSQALERLHRIRVLEKRLEELVDSQPTPVPDTLDHFEDWCKEHLSPSVVLVGRAHQGVRKSEYHDPALLYRALIVLRDYYVPMRTDGSVTRVQYESALRDLTLEDSQTGDGTRFFPDVYTVQYGARRRWLDHHLKGGDSRDRRYGFRLYYFWEDDEEVVVVGWLPSHLDNKRT